MEENNSLRILLIAWNFPPKVGGIEYLLSNLMNQIKSKISVEIIAPFHEKNESSSDNIHHVGKDGLIWFFIYGLFLSLKVLRQKEIDVLVGGSGLLTPLVYIVGIFFRKPVVVYTYGLDLTYSNRIYQTMLRIFLPKIDQVIAISRDTTAKAINLGVSEDKISLIFPGIHADQYDLDQEQSELKQKYDLTDKNILLYAGRLAKRKGIYEFICHSLPTIVEKNPDVLFCIVGGNPQGSLMHKEDIFQKITDEISERQLTPFVRFFGWLPRKQLLELFAASDIFLLPAVPVKGDMEGFGIVMAEANAAGKPVVSTRIGGIPDAVVDNKSAILVEPGDWKGYSKAVLNLLEDESLRNKLGKYGAGRAANELDWRIIGEQFQKVIYEAASLND